jgi:hypothetical protein
MRAEAWKVAWVDAAGADTQRAFSVESEAWLFFGRLRRHMFFSGDSEVSISGPRGRVLTVVQGVAQVSRFHERGDCDGQEADVAATAVGGGGQQRGR